MLGNNYEPIYKNPTNVRELLGGKIDTFDKIVSDLQNPLNKIATQINKLDGDAFFNDCFLTYRNVKPNEYAPAQFVQDFRETSLRLFSIFGSFEVIYVRNDYYEKYYDYAVNINLFGKRFGFTIRVDLINKKIERFEPFEGLLLKIDDISKDELSTIVDGKKHGGRYGTLHRETIQNICYRSIHKYCLETKIISDDDIRLLFLLERILFAESIYRKEYLNYNINKTVGSGGQLEEILKYLDANNRLDIVNVRDDNVIIHPNKEYYNDTLKNYTFDGFIKDEKLNLKNKSNPRDISFNETKSQDFADATKDFMLQKIALDFSRILNPDYNVKQSLSDIVLIMKLSLFEGYIRAYNNRKHYYSATKTILDGIVNGVLNTYGNPEPSDTQVNLFNILFGNLKKATVEDAENNIVKRIYEITNYFFKNKKDILDEVSYYHQIKINKKAFEKYGLNDFRFELDIGGLSYVHTYEEYYKFFISDSREYINKILVDNFGTSDMKKICEIMVQKQYDSIKSDGFINISEPDIKTLLSKQNGFVKVTKYDIINWGETLKLYLDDNSTININGNGPIDISSSYNGLGSTVSKEGITVFGSMKLSSIDLSNTNNVQITFGNSRFLLKTKLKISIYN